MAPTLGVALGNSHYLTLKLGKNMCGISAVVHQDECLQVEDMISMSDAIAHRGPDDSGAIVLRSLDPDALPSNLGDIGLGHRRLAIIDTTFRGHQPMMSKKGKSWITFNGEIYNYTEIRKELTSRGHIFVSDTDTEVLLSGYDEWGVEVLDYLNGMFAFAIWDSKQRMLFVARDRLGIKPLYYFENDRQFVCASELKAIFKYKDFKADLRKDSLSHYLVQGYIPSPATVFKNVYKLPPGHLLQKSFGEPAKICQYWDPIPYYQNASNKNDETETQAQLDDLLQSSIHYRMISDVPLGALLSGGIDSSLVVSLMQEQSTKPVKTFTIGFSERKYNESNHARAVAEYLGTDHHELIVNERTLLNIVPDITSYYDEPFADTSSIPSLAVSHLARQHVTVALSGDGGDETFLGYATYKWMQKHEHIRRLLPGKLIRLGTGIAKRLPSRRISRMGEYISFNNAVYAHRWAVAYWQPSELQKLLNDHEGVQFYKTFSDLALERLTGSELTQRMAAADLTTYMVDDILTKVDRASMAFALEVRVPLLDHRIVEFAAGIPINLKNHQNKNKYLLRKILYQRLPQELFNRPKQGFNVPIEKWLRGSLRELLISYTSSSKLKLHDLFQSNYVSKIVNEHIRGKQDHGKKLWNILVFQMWFEKYLA